jgi:hypothetical protein
MFLIGGAGTPSVVGDRDLAIAWRDLVARWDALVDPDDKEGNGLCGPRAEIEKQLLLGVEGRTRAATETAAAASERRYLSSMNRFLAERWSRRR